MGDFRQVSPEANLVISSHTFLFHPGKWKLFGWNYDTDGKRTKFAGSVECVVVAPDHYQSRMWYLLDREGAPRVEEITDCRLAGSFFRFEQEHSVNGRLDGEGFVSQRSICQHYRSADGALGGYETLLREAPEKYFGHGLYLRDGNLVSVAEIWLSLEHNPESAAE
ncbi:MAG: hypothetical protein V2A74_09775 [bacterium]